MNKFRTRLIATSATRKLQNIVGSCAVVFTIGTILNFFVMNNTLIIEEIMRREGVTNPAEMASGFLEMFRIQGFIYILWNALGILAFRSRSLVLWWAVFGVNITQGMGFIMIPSSMWSVTFDMYGVWGILPSAVTDGGAMILAIIMIYTMIKNRSTWAQRRLPQQ